MSSFFFVYREKISVHETDEYKKTLASCNEADSYIVQKVKF